MGAATIWLWQHFSRLLDFRGRENPASFWPYAAVAFIIIMLAGMMIFVPIMTRSMAAMQQYAVQHPDQVTVTSGPGQYSISVEGNHPAFFDAGSTALYLVVSFGLSIALYAAAVTRRLHDRGKAGWWGLMPLPFVIYSTIMMPVVFGTTRTPNMALFFSIFLSNLVYIVTLVWLIVILAGGSQDGSNRYDVAM